MLVDEKDIKIKAGDGGEGVVSFGRYQKSGPDGGNGGKGGNVYIIGDSDLTLLSEFRGKKIISAENGGGGANEKRTGKDGADLEIKLPVGSLLKDKETGEEYELTKVGQRILLCLGGKGGIGNFELRSSRNVTPMNRIRATKGQSRNLFISLRFLADYGLIGLPSAGKSSLINELTNTKAKTASYHFTTLSPNLGVLPNKKIIADIPGLIEGASQGKGLGIKFLKHIQKVSLLLHCIALDSEDVENDYKTIRKELGEYDKELLEKSEIILLTKSDLVDVKEIAAKKKALSKYCKEIYPVSIHDMDSIEKLFSLL